MEQLNIPTKQLLENIFLQSTNVIAVTNADFTDLKFEYVNPAFLEMTGYTSDEIIGRSPKILQGPLTKRDMTKRLKESCLKGETFRGDNINYKKDGSTYIVGWTVTPIKDDDGKIINFLSIQKDITQIKKLEKENIEAQRLQALGQISSGLTHELNTALTNCKGSLEMIGYSIDGIKDEITKNYLTEDISAVKKGIDYISFLTNSLHYLTNTNSLIKNEESVYDIVLDSLQSYEKLSKITHCKINGKDIETLSHEDITQLKAITQSVDKKSLRHLFMIIIDNALDELVKKPKEDNLLQINITKDKFTQIEIVDNAGGMSTDVIEKLFDPLTRRKQLGGLGIGLYVAKNIAQAHDATIDVSSVSQNSSFKVVFSS